MPDQTKKNELLIFLNTANYVQCVSDSVSLRDLSIILAGSKLTEVFVISRQQDFMFIFTIDDFAKSIANDYTLESKISEIKSSFSKFSLTAENSISEATEVMETEKFGSLPYLSEGKVVGTISLKDLHGFESENGKRKPKNWNVANSILKTRSITQLLVVEDDPDLQAHLKDLLIRNGFGVSCAPSSEDALVELKRKPYDLVLSDIRLPDSDGIDLYLNSKNLKRKIPFILMSGYLDYYLERLDLIEIDKSYTLAKPINVGTLLSTIEKRLSESSK